MKPRKDQSIETLRGVAIILMVSYHIITNSTYDVALGEYGFFRHLSYTFDYLRMPLFTVISGFVYALKPVTPGMLERFYKGKGRRILIPLISISTLEYFSRLFIPGVNVKAPIAEIWEIYFFGYMHYWFLQAVFLVFILVGFLDSLKFLNSEKRILSFFLISCLISVLAPRPYFFSIGAAFYLLPFFTLGVALKRFTPSFNKKNLKILSLIIFILGMTLHQYFWFFDEPLIEGSFKRLHTLWVGVFGLFVFLQMTWVNTPLSRLGHYAYTIYLFHGFSMFFGNRLAGLVFKESVFYPAALFGFSLASGLILPVILEKILGNSNWFRMVFMGLRPIGRKI